MDDLTKYRDDFPMLKTSMHGKPLIYFDSAATAQKPKIVIDALTNFYQEHYGTVHRAIYELAVYSTQCFHEAREKARKFINASKVEEIIFTRGTTESINLVANSFGKAFLKKGTEVIISEIEHHSNIVPWQMICEEMGAKLQIIPCNDRGELDLETYSRLLSEKTKMVAVTHVSNSLGTLNPVKKMTEMAHAVEASVLIDAAQSAPHLPVDVQDIGADFLVFSGHKVFGPTGIGVLYGKKELLEVLPPYQGGGDMIETVTFPKTTYNPPPLKFEAGTPSFAEVIALGTALDYLMAIGMEKIQLWEKDLLEYATKRIVEIPDLQIIGTAKEKGAILSFIVKGIHPLDIGTLLDLRGIAIRTGFHCAQPAMRHFTEQGTARASFALYNNKDEIDFFIEKLHECVRQLKR